ncbi:MAG: Gfo/Idh/MocA family protein [Gemmiger sp.]
MKLAILSTSRIVDEFLQNAANMPELALEALCCRPQSEAKARAWAAQYGIPRVYTDEAALYADGGFDGVYIGTANHLHYEAAKRALQAGFHVMLEKPFTHTLAEAQELYALADEKGLVLMEAITIP